MSNFWLRTLSGTLYVAVVVGSILWNNGMAFAPIMAIVCVMGVNEYMKLINAHLSMRVLGIISAALLFTIFYTYYTQPEMTKCVTIAYLISVLCALLWELFRFPTSPITNWGNFVGSQVMIALPFSMMNGILSKSPYLLLALFITIWVNDSGAYCIGSLMSKRKGGNHKLFERVSPNKSWEGFFGGVFFAIIAGVIYWKSGWMDALDWTESSIANSIIFVTIIAIFGTIGDLMESLMKRTIGVKDSGNFLPGHGGVLDRFDSLLLSSVVVYILCSLC